MNFPRSLLAAASLLGSVSACSEGAGDNQFPASADEAISTDNRLGTAYETSNSSGEAQLQAPAPAAAARIYEPASKAEPGETAPTLAKKTEAPRPAPKAAPKAPANVEPKAASEAEGKAAPAAPAATPACAPEHRAMGHC